MLPETSLEQAGQQAERLRLALEKSVVSLSDIDIKVTASFGVAGSQQHQINGDKLSQHSLEDMINLSDDALYKAKRLGKNQVILSSATANKSVKA